MLAKTKSESTSRRSPFNMLRTDDERELVRVMIEARLFVSELSGDVPSFGVAHEALLRRWKRVSDWIDLFRDALQLRTRLDGQAERWATAKRPGDLLLPKGSQVDKAVELLNQDDIALSPAIQEYAQASLRRAKRGERIRLSVTALIALLAVLTGIFGLGARSAQKEADRRRIDAEDLMTFMLGDLAEKLRPMGKLEILDNISAKSLAYLSRPQPHESSKVALFQKAKALHMIAEVDISRSKRSEAESALSAARMLLQQANLILPSDRQFLRELGLNSFLSGQIYFYENKLDQAEQQMRQYLDYSSQFAATDPADLEGMVQKSRAHTSVGTLALRRGDNQAAGKEFANSMVLKRQLLAKTPGDETLSVDLANTVSWLAETKVNTGQLHEAMQLYRQEEELLRPLYSKNATWTSRIALSKWRQALLNVAFGQPEAARSDLQEAHRLMQKIVNDEPTNSAWRLRLYMVDLRLLEVAGGRTSPADSLRRLESLYSALNELSEHEPPNKQLALQIAKSQYLMGDVLLGLGKRDMAITKFDSAIASISGLDKDEIQAGFLAEALLKRARAAKESPDKAAHRAFCTQARDVLSPYLSKQAHYSMVALQFEANTCLGDFDALVPLRQQLDQMYYREGQYLRLLTSLPTQKGKPQ